MKKIDLLHSLPLPATTDGPNGYKDVPIDLVLHTPGGLVLASLQIARAIQAHKGKVTVVVPHYAMSGGTLIALAADEIMMDSHAVLGPVDPQLGHYPAASLVKLSNIRELLPDSFERMAGRNAKEFFGPGK